MSKWTFWAFIVFAVFFSWLAMSGCGDNLDPQVETCDDVAQLLCPALAECGNLLVSEDECLVQLVPFCEPWGAEAFDLSNMSCEALDDGAYLPEGAGP